jgi:hypothetical protein
MDAGLRGRVGLLCEQLSRWPSLRTIIGDAGARTELADLLAVLADPREPEADRVRTLLDAIDKACVGVGLTGLTSRTKAPDAGLTLPYGVNAVPGLVGWTCPLGRCDRVVTRKEAADPPTCAPGRDTRMKPYTLPPR